MFRSCSSSPRIVCSRSARLTCRRSYAGIMFVSSSAFFSFSAISSSSARRFSCRASSFMLVSASSLAMCSMRSTSARSTPSMPFSRRNAVYASSSAARSSSLPATFGFLSVYTSRSLAISASTAAISALFLRMNAAFAATMPPSEPTPSSCFFFFSSSLAVSMARSERLRLWSDRSLFTIVSDSTGATMPVWPFSAPASLSMAAIWSRSPCLRESSDSRQFSRSLARYSTYSSIRTSA